MSLRPKRKEKRLSKKEAYSLSHGPWFPYDKPKPVNVKIKKADSKEMQEWLMYNRIEVPSSWGTSLGRSKATINVDSQEVLVTPEIKVEQLKYEIAHKLITEDKKNRLTYDRIFDPDEPLIWADIHKATDKEIDVTIGFWESEIENYDLFDEMNAKDMLEPIVRKVFPIPKDYLDAKVDKSFLERDDFKVDTGFKEGGGHDVDDYPEGMELHITARNSGIDDKQYILDHYIGEYIKFNELEWGKDDNITRDAYKWRDTVKQMWGIT